MAQWQITSEAGLNMGVFKGETAEDAVRAMNRDAGLSGEELDRNDGLVVQQVFWATDGDGGADIEGCGTPAEVAQKYVDTADWGDHSVTLWIDVHIYDAQPGGPDAEDHYVDTITVPIHPNQKNMNEFCCCETCGVEGVRTERPGETPEGADFTDELICADEDGHLICDACYKEKAELCEVQKCDCCGEMAPKGLVYTLPSGATRCHDCSVADTLVY